MSRIGKNPITIPSGVEVNINGSIVTVKGAKGVLTQEIESSIQLSIEDGVITFTRESESPAHRAKHGLYRALINNMIVGVSEGFKKEMEVVGVGYRATTDGQRLELMVGYSHPIVIELPSEIKVSAETTKGQAPLITLESFDKQLIGQVAAKIRSFRKPEPYKGKGIKFKGEQIRRKAGKSAGKK
jgi:large subunit ribosomal protein L6